MKNNREKLRFPIKLNHKKLRFPIGGVNTLYQIRKVDTEKCFHLKLEIQ